MKSKDNSYNTSDFWRMCDGLENEPDLVPISRFSAVILAMAAAAMDLQKTCESPIEMMLGVAVTMSLSPGERLQPQFCLERFRYDFALIGRKTILIECDGAEFHSTLEQKENDIRKNFAATQHGMLLLRFTGSDIFNRVGDCAALALNVLRRP